VFNAQMIMQEKGILIPQLYNETHVYSAHVIQRAFRSWLVNRFKIGR